MTLVQDWHDLRPKVKYNLHPKGELEPLSRNVKLYVVRDGGQSAVFCVPHQEEFWKHNWDVWLA
ncbi:hypothetical protein [Nocardia fluminea]|uniref:hypothetical protein n=1 Tax=Nocardia fluminea TaxID=134984 RepID=UPI003421D192